jgi:hypothetical protein
MDKIVPSLLSRGSDSIEKLAAAPLRALPTGSELSFLSLTTSSGDGGGRGGLGSFSFVVRIGGRCTEWRTVSSHCSTATCYH